MDDPPCEPYRGCPKKNKVSKKIHAKIMQVAGKNLNEKNQLV
jgi:hypothetical protein